MYQTACATRHLGASQDNLGDLRQLFANDIVLCRSLSARIVFLCSDSETSSRNLLKLRGANGLSKTQKTHSGQETWPINDNLIDTFTFQHLRCGGL